MMREVDAAFSHRLTGSPHWGRWSASAHLTAAIRGRWAASGFDRMAPEVAARIAILFFF